VRRQAPARGSEQRAGGAGGAGTRVSAGASSAAHAARALGIQAARARRQALAQRLRLGGRSTQGSSGGVVWRWAGAGAGAGACAGAGRGAGERRWGTGGGERLAAAQTLVSPGRGDYDGAALAAHELKAHQCLALGGLSQKVEALPEVSARLTAMA
jgi:hypothetical protein